MCGFCSRARGQSVAAKGGVGELLRMSEEYRRKVVMVRVDGNNGEGGRVCSPAIQCYFEVREYLC